MIITAIALKNRQGVLKKEAPTPLVEEKSHMVMCPCDPRNFLQVLYYWKAASGIKMGILFSWVLSLHWTHHAFYHISCWAHLSAQTSMWSSSFSLCNFCQFWLERWGIVAQFLSAYIVKLTAMKVCKISITTFTLECRWNHVNFFALHNKHIVISTLTSGMMYDWLWSMKFLNSIFFQWC